MAMPDPKYIPKPKEKKKIAKTKTAVVKSAFPTPARKPKTKSLKKKAPFGDHYVWSK